MENAYETETFLNFLNENRKAREYKAVFTFRDSVGVLDKGKQIPLFVNVRKWEDGLYHALNKAVDIAELNGIKPSMLLKIEIAGHRLYRKDFGYGNGQGETPFYNEETKLYNLDKFAMDETPAGTKLRK